ncbi:MAG: hypothetical protein R3Y19_06575, partial [Rikenellaceae bacterium]
DLRLGEVCVVRSDYFADLGGWRGDHLDRFDSTVYRALDFELPFLGVAGATVTTACTPLVDYCDVQVETMEGAALYMVCREYGVAALGLRSISNYIDTPRERWQIPEAVEALGRALDTTLDLMSGR